MDCPGIVMSTASLWPQYVQFPFYWIDAFASKKLGGNPWAVVLGADSLSADEMQAFAKEMNLSETAFVVASRNADFAARYFTPTEELPFAGHPTIATIHALQQAEVEVIGDAGNIEGIRVAGLAETLIVGNLRL